MCIILQNVFDDVVLSPPNELVRMSTLREDQKVSLGSYMLYQAVLTGQREICTLVSVLLFSV